MMDELEQTSAGEQTGAGEQKGAREQITVREQGEVAQTTPPLAPPQYYESRTQQFPSWFDILAILGLFLITQLITKAIYDYMGFEVINSDDIAQMSIMQQRNAEFEMGYNIFIWSIISQPLLLFLVVLYRTFRGGKAFVVKWSIKGFDPITILWGVLMLLSTSVVIEPLMELLPNSPIPDGRGVYMLISLLLVAPFFEELLCRGVIFEAVRRKRGAWAACIISSLIFGVMHLEPQFVLNAFVVGILLSYLYLRANSIFAPMILHSFNNILSYLLLMLGLSQSSLKEILGGGMLYNTLYGIAAVLLLVSVIALSRHITKIERGDHAKEAASKGDTIL